MTDRDAVARPEAEPSIPSAPAVVLLDLTGNDALLRRLSVAGHPRPLVALAEALGSSPPARTMPDVVLAVRDKPRPQLVFVGEIDAAGRARIDELGGLLAEAGARLRILDWAAVERACETLADHLRQYLGSERLQRVALVGVPRGGDIVAGLLAYALGIPRERVGSYTGVETVVLIDDCSLSGVRLREVLAGIDRTPQLIIATLASHPDLRTALLAAEPDVEAFISGIDLEDHSDSMLGAGAGAWRRRQQAAVPERYHTALLDLLVFPWSEPEVRLHNPVTGKVEPHWWLAPPGSCLHHRSATPGLEIQYLDEDPAQQVLRAEVIAVTQGDATVLVDTHDGRTLRLSGTARALFETWTATGSVPAAVAAIAEQYEVSTARVTLDLHTLLDELRSRELIFPAEREPLRSGTTSTT